MRLSANFCDGVLPLPVQVDHLSVEGSRAYVRQGLVAAAFLELHVGYAAVVHAGQVSPVGIEVMMSGACSAASISIALKPRSTLFFRILLPYEEDKAHAGPS